jgi:demethylmenaquinone methyltransferase / 2-methoxy-6-polyprenyl-1,4-benzoquinol methylase
LMEYYWATIDGCVPPETILAALRQAEFQSVERRTCGPILSEYIGKRAR